MAKTIRIPFDDISNNFTIREAMEKHFKAHGVDLHVNEVIKFEDDPKRRERVIVVKNTKYHRT